MNLMINGEDHSYEGPKTLPDLLLFLRLPDRGILVEHNGLALRTDEWAGLSLHEGDRLEIIRIVAGG
jgi:thiamine biosynthesis protein ThiS